MKKWTSPTNDGTYSSWRAMMRRCLGRDVHSAYYANITVCEAWKNFDAFYKDMGPRPMGMTLGRTDNSRGYEPSNCRWANRLMQVNNRRNTISLTHEGKTTTLSEWATYLNLPYYLVWNRKKAGLPTTEILSPVLRRSLSAQHGTTTRYAKGCRCEACRTARAEWYQKYMKERHG